MLNLNSIMVGTMQQKVMAEFYEKVVGRKPDMAEDTMAGWAVGSTFLGVMEHSEAQGMSKEPARIILNFETKEVKEEFERIKAIKGAVVIKEPYEMQGAWIATLSDPDGNYFQLMTPWDSGK